MATIKWNDGTTSVTTGFGITQAPSVGQALNNVSDINPDEIAEEERLSQKLSMPIDVVRNNKTTAKRLADAPDLSFIYNTAPVLADTVSTNVNFTAKASDDLNNLAKAEQGIQMLSAHKNPNSNLTNEQRAEWQKQFRNAEADLAISKYIPSWMPSFIANADMTKEFASGQAMDRAGLLWAKRRELARQGKDLSPAELKYLDDMDKASGFDSSQTGIRSFVNSAAEVIGQQFESFTSKEKNPLAYGITTGMTMAGASAAAGPAAPLAVLPAFSSGMSAGMSYGVFERSRLIEGGQAYKEFILMQDKSGNVVDPKTAAVASDIVGVINGTLELVGFEQMAKVLPGLRKAMGRGAMDVIKKNPTVKDAFIDFAKKYAAGVGSETATEIAQELTNIFVGGMGLEGKSASEIVTDPQTFEQIKDIAGKTAKAMIVLGGVGGGASFATDAYRINKYNTTMMKAQQAHDAFVESMTSGELSKLRERSPDTFGEHMQRVAEHYGLDSVYLQSDRLIEEAQKQGWSNDQLAAWASQYGVEREQLNTDLMAGDTVALKIGDVAKNWGNDEVLTLFQNDLTIDPNIPSKVNAENASQAENETMVRLSELYQQEQDNLIQPEDLDTWKEALLSVDTKGRVKAEHLDIMAATANVYAKSPEAKAKGIKAIDFANMLLGREGLRVMKFKDWQAGREQSEVMQRNTVDISNLNTDSVNEFETGKPVTFSFTHNTQSATKIFGKPKKDSPYDRGYEPSGRYVNQVTPGTQPITDKHIVGDITFNNPLVVKGEGWKRNLSEVFGGKTGKRLSQAIVDAGYDGVVTVQEGKTQGKYVSEILDLTTFDKSKALYQLNFEQSADYTFTESDYRPAVMEWAKEQFGDTVAENGKPAWQNFTVWFGNSQVVDEQGKPLVVYHGTDAEFDTFEQRKGKVSTIFGSENVERLGYFFAPDASLAEAFGSKVMPVYLKADKVLDLSSGYIPEDVIDVLVKKGWSEKYLRNLPQADTWTLLDGEDAKEFVETIQGIGYDSVALFEKMREGYPSGKSYVVFSPTQIKSVYNRGTFDPNDANILNQSASHYSPHTFDKFSTSAIGTGEGNQAYGYGLYFFTSEEVGKYYKDMFDKQAPLAIDGKTIDQWREEIPTPIWSHIDQYYADGYDTKDMLLMKLDFAREYEKSRGNKYFPDSDYQQVIDAIKGSELIERQGKARRYNVELAPAEDEYLLWDKPLSEQSEKVKAALVNDKKVIEARSLHEYFDANDKWWDGVGATGQSAYLAAENVLGSDRAASEYLHSLGIRGIKYEDGNTRNKEEKSYNYVIFSDDDVAITEMFQKNNNNPLAALWQENGQNIVGLFEGADKSSFLHETGHIFLNFMKQMAEQHGIQADVWASTKEWLGVGEDGVITREMHEKFAEHFEVYLMEGKAPTPTLRQAFRSFKNWLLKIYEGIGKRAGQRSNITLSDDVRTIFDKMLATEQEIRMAQEQAALVAMLDNQLLNASGFTQEQINEYRALANQVHDSAAEKRDNHKLGGLKERLAGFREQATREAGTVPIYGIIDWITNKNQPQPISKESIAAVLGKDAVKNLPSITGLFSKDGMHIDHAIAEFGEQFGYTSAAQLVADLNKMQPRQQWIEKRVAQLEIEHDMSQETDEAIRTASLRKMLEIESQWLAKMAAQKENADINKAIRTTNHIPLDQIRAWAKDIISKRTMKQIGNIGKMLAESRKHRQKAIMLAKQQKWAEALKANEQARMTEELIAQSYKARNEHQKQQNAWKKAINSKSMDFDYQQTLWRMMLDFGATNRKLDVREDTKDIRTFFADMFGMAQDDLDALGLPVVPDWMMNNPVPYKEMTWEQINDFNDMVGFLYGRGKEIRDAVMADGKTKIADARRACIEAMSGIKRNRMGQALFKEGTRLRKAQDYVRGYMARNRILLPLFRHLDSFINIGKNGRAGSNETLVWSPINEGGKKKLVLHQQMAQLVQPHIDQLLKRAKEEFTHVAIPEEMARDNRTWTWERVVAVALNMGNEANMARVMNGFHYTQMEEDGTTTERGMSREDLLNLTSVLTTEDWHAVQGIWDAIDTLYPELNAVHKRINHFPMKKVKPNSITVKNSAGMDVELKGGYYPIKFDGGLDLDVAAWTEKDDILNRTEMIRQVPNPKSGMTKDRMGNSVQRPVLLSLSVLGSHIEDVVNYISLAESVRDADRITRSKDYRTRAQEVLGKEGYDVIRPNLKGIIRPESTPRTEIERWIEKSRAMTSMYVMGYNLWTAVQNITGIFPLVRDIGWGTYLKGCDVVRKNPIKAYKTMMELSPYMRMRMDNFDRDVKKQLMHFKPEFSVKGMTVQDIRDAGFWGIKAVDMANAMPCWWGAYNKALQTMTPEEAIKYADTKIQSSQGSGNAIDLSMHQRAQGVTRLFTNFMTFAITQQNILANDLNAFREGKMSKGQYAYGLMMVLILPALASTIMQNAIQSGEPPEPEELAIDQLSYLLAGFPFLREIVNLRNLKPGVPRGKLRAASLEGTQKIADTVTDLGQLGLKWGKGEYEDKYLQKVIWDAADMGSWATGLPAAPMYKKWQRGAKQIEENGGHWWNLLIPDPKVKMPVEELFN